MPQDFAIPELTAVSDAIAQAEGAGFNPLDPAGLLTISSVKNGKQALNRYVFQLDAVARSCRDVPPALAASYRAWRAQWDGFYNRAVWPWTVANDNRQLAAHQAQAADFHDRLAEYCEVPDAPAAPGGGGGGFNPLDPLGLFGGGGGADKPGPVDKVTDTIKTVAIVGGVLALVFIVGAAYVASKNVRAGGEVVGGYLGGRRH